MPLAWSGRRSPSRRAGCAGSWHVPTPPQHVLGASGRNRQPALPSFLTQFANGCEDTAKPERDWEPEPLRLPAVPAGCVLQRGGAALRRGRVSRARLGTARRCGASRPGRSASESFNGGDKAAEVPGGTQG